MQSIYFNIDSVVTHWRSSICFLFAEIRPCQAISVSRFQH